ncbi:MAG: hypothetical protein ACE5KG_00215 [Nitrososphaerales archaeon]
MSNSGKPENEVKDFAKRSGALVAGIASAKSIDDEAPQGHRPSDVLEGAKSVIVLGGGKINIGAYKSPMAYIPGYISSVKVQTVHRIAFKLADYLEKKYNYYAIFSPQALSGANQPLIDDQLCAIKAGLGTRAIAAYRVLSKKFGFLNYASVITTMPLKPDHPLEKAVCPAPECVDMWEESGTTPCLQVCPQCLKAEIKDGTIKKIQFNRMVHESRSQTTSTSAFQKILLEALNETDPEKKKMMLLGDFFSRTIRSMAYNYNLTGTTVECLRVCPVEQRSYGKPKGGP